MVDTEIIFNGQKYQAKYNSQSGYYEIEIKAPNTGGVYKADITFTDCFQNKHTDAKNIQILAKEKIEIQTNKIFIWIFDGYDFKVKDIVELSDFDINIDEETNANTILKILKETTIVAKDIVAVKEGKKTTFWGIVDNIENESGQKSYQITLKYITNMFDQTVELKNEELIKTKGIEDFIAQTIIDNFVENEDAFVNKEYLEIVVETHTKLQKSVDNVENGIFNLLTWMTNCTQNYNIVYKISIVEKKLRITIKKEQLKKELVDVFAHSISNYTEVFETRIVSKVKVITKEEGSYTLYLLTDRTTTTDKNNVNRAAGETEIIYTEKMEDARQTALDIFKQNSYEHMISFRNER